MSLVIKNLATKETIECWDFNVQYEDGTSTVEKGLSKPLAAIGNILVSINQLDTKFSIPENKEKQPSSAEVGTKDIKVIQREIRDVMLQICSTITFLPFLDCLCKIVY